MMWRTDAIDCVYDLFSFIEEQIQLGKSNPADQFAAIDAASGVIPMIWKRLESNEPLQAKLALLFDDCVTWQRGWSELAAMGRAEFEAKVDGVLQTVAVAKSLLP